MIFFITVLGMSLLIAVGSYLLLSGITVKELSVQIGVQIIVAAASAAIVYHANTSDVNMLNGRVTGKKQEWVSCSHSYPCNCHTHCSSGKNSTCTTTCQTCYWHPNDWDWRVFSTIGSINIARIDSRGSNMPPRWAAVQIGEPFSMRQSYTNYIKAAPGTLLKHQGLVEKYARFIPEEEPIVVYDYYRSNRLILLNGVQLPNKHKWEAALSEINAELGAKKQVNIILVLTKKLPQEFFYALEQAWIGGKQNDAILVVNVDQATMQPQWATVMSWNIGSDLEVKLRDAVMDLPAIELEPTINLLRDQVDTYYKRKPMADFEYLASTITPTTTEWVVSLLISLILSLCLSIWFHREDVFGDENRFSY